MMVMNLHSSVDFDKDNDKVVVDNKQALLNLQETIIGLAEIVVNPAVSLACQRRAIAEIAKIQIAIMEQSETIDYNLEYQKRCAEEDAKEAAEKVDN